MSSGDTQNDYRVVYVGSGRRMRWGIPRQGERAWREALAAEQERVCVEMASRGLRLLHVVPVLSSSGFQGAWTEGAWLYFGAAP